jgi:hypothetical protein
MYFCIFEGGVFFLRPTVIMECSMDYFSFPPHIWIIAIPVFLIALLAWIVDNHRLYNRSVAVIRVGFLLAMVFSFALYLDWLLHALALVWLPGFSFFPALWDQPPGPRSAGPAHHRAVSSSCEHGIVAATQDQ